MKAWLAPDIVEHRAALCGEVIAILTSSIGRLHASLDAGGSQAQSVRETGIEYDMEPVPLTLDTSGKGQGASVKGKIAKRLPSP